VKIDRYIDAGARRTVAHIPPIARQSMYASSVKDAVEVVESALVDGGGVVDQQLPRAPSTRNAARR
jgi:hypothetical protein